jgi:hypothetical protein
MFKRLLRFACIVAVATIPPSSIAQGDWRNSVKDPKMREKLEKYEIDIYDGPNARQQLPQAITNGLSQGLASRTENATNKLLQGRERTTDGQWQLAVMFEGMGQNLDDFGKYGGSWERYPRMFETWRTEYPTSSNAAVAEAVYWIAYAFYARGGDYAREVPRKAWETFRERLDRAKVILDDSESYEKANPHWHTEMIYLAFAQGRPLSEQTELFEAAVKMEPYYYSHYLNYAMGLTPKWGGNLGSFHRFVEDAVARTREKDGTSMYVRLYSLLAFVEWERDPFTELGVSWPKLRQGFNDLLERYPNSKWNVAEYARFACRAGDGATFLRLMPQIADKKEFTTPWQGAYTFDYCKTAFLQKV